MKKLLRLIFMVGIILSFGLTSNLYAMSAADMTYMTEEYPPFNFTKDGKLQGVAVDLLKAVWSEMGVPEQKVKIYPWARAYKSALSKPGTVLFSTTRNPEREHLFKWVGPIKSNPIGVIAKKSSHIKINSFDDLKQYKIGTIRDDFSETVLTNKGIKPNRLDRNSELSSNVMKLNAGRIDLIVNNIEGAFQIIKENGLNPDDYETVWQLSDLPLNYAFHISTPQSLIDDFQAALNKLESKRQKILLQYKK